MGSFPETYNDPFFSRILIKYTSWKVSFHFLSPVTLTRVFLIGG